MKRIKTCLVLAITVLFILFLNGCDGTDSEPVPEPPVTEPANAIPINEDSTPLACGLHQAALKMQPLSYCDDQRNWQTIEFSEIQENEKGFLYSMGTYSHDNVILDVTIWGKDGETIKNFISTSENNTLFCFEYVSPVTAPAQMDGGEPGEEPRETFEIKDANLLIEIEDRGLASNSLEAYGIRFFIDPSISNGVTHVYSPKNVSGVSQNVYVTNDGKVRASIFKDHKWLSSKIVKRLVTGSFYDNNGNLSVNYALYVTGQSDVEARYGLCGIWNKSP